MVELSGKQRVLKGFKELGLKEYERAIRIFYRILQEDKHAKIRMFAFYGLGDALRSIHELETAGRMYEKALHLAECLENSKMIRFLSDRIEHLYIFDKDPNLNPVQIEFFMRSIIKLLSMLGKDDWF